MIEHFVAECLINFLPEHTYLSLSHKPYTKDQLLINISLVLENRRAAMIFIKYMHDIVLKISFLDINSQNWNTGGHLKL